jgi:AbrB family looped-hinge helix DNA binding protein
MRVNPKGQVTIPAALRRKHGIGPASEVEFIDFQGRLVLQRMPGRRGSARLIARMRGRARKGITTDQIMELTRGL